MAGNLTRIILIGKLTRPQEGNRLSTDNDSLFIYKFHSELCQGRRVFDEVGDEFTREPYQELLSQVRQTIERMQDNCSHK